MATDALNPAPAEQGCFQAFFRGTLAPSPFYALWFCSDPLLSRRSILIPLFLESESQEQ